MFASLVFFSFFLSHTTFAASSSSSINNTCYVPSTKSQNTTLLALSEYNTTIYNNAIKACVSICAAKSFAYAGVQKSNCYCGNKINTKLSDSPLNTCNTVCHGKKTERCGGSNGINIVATGICSKPLIRKEWRELTLAQQQKYLKGVRLLMTQKSIMGNANRYEDFSATHMSNANQCHWVPAFLPWHRWFIKTYEIALQQVLKDNTFTLPYWDWTIDSQAPELSPLLNSSKDAFGTNGYNTSGNVMDGAFANFKVSVGRNGTLQRCGTKTIGSWYSTEQMIYLVNNTDGHSGNYEDFHNGLEGGPHGAVHINLGGDMYNMFSPNDPLFYMVWFFKFVFRPSVFTHETPPPPPLLPFLSILSTMLLSTSCGMNGK